MRHYFAIIHKDKGSDYGISFPDFPGCVTAARSVEAVVKAAVEALSGHIGLMVATGQTIPAPSPIETVMATTREEQGWPQLIQLPDPKPGAVRLSVTLPEGPAEGDRRLRRAAGLYPLRPSGARGEEHDREIVARRGRHQAQARAPRRGVVPTSPLRATRVAGRAPENRLKDFRELRIRNRLTTRLSGRRA